jgi:hypothetical protein
MIMLTKTAISVLVLTVYSTCLYGGAISILSGTDPTGTSQWNDQRGFGVANVVLVPNPNWAQPVGGMQWVSYMDTGLGGAELPNDGTYGAIGPSPTASFFVSFNLPNPINSGGITVWADDTAAVFLVDNSAAPQLLDGPNLGPADVHCVSGPISCGQSEGGFVNLTGLSAGTHTLRIDAWQLGGHEFGVMYTGLINSDPVPEPGTASYTLLFIAGTALFYFVRTKCA